MNSLWFQSEFTDAILVAEDVEFACHKNVLACSSAYFKAMFTIDLKERTSNKIQVGGIMRKGP